LFVAAKAEVRENSSPIQLKYILKEKRMADFKKSLVLAAMALAVGVGTASAQTGVPTCIGTTGAVPTLRAEGQAELTGNIVLTCSNIVVGQSINFDVLLNGGQVPITSRENPSEAMLTISYPGTGTPSATYVASYTSTNGTFNNDARFTGVLINGPNPQVSISGVRGNVNPQYVQVSQTTTFGTVLATISTSNGNFPISQVGGGFFVGIVLPGLGTVSGSTTGITVQSCSGGAPIPSGTIFPVNIPENFPTAFKVIGPVPNTDSETGIVPGAMQANSATQFAVTFSNIPSGVSFYVPETITSSSGGVAELVGSEGSSLGLVTTYTPGLSIGVSAPGVIDPATGDVLYYPLAAGTTVFYNVVAANPSAIDTFVMNVIPSGTVSATTGTPTVSVVLAPRAVVNNVQSISVPRFISLQTSGSNLPVISVAPCQTTLLFPYLTNQAGFDSGFSIAATSADPFGTFAQGGTCTLNMYGVGAPTTAPTLTVPTAGEGHNTVSAVAPGFQGYVIAVCNFQYAHGYAFLSNGFSGVGNGGLSEGYVALEVGNSRIGTPSTAVNTYSGGESLGH
jgi:hypothetical protein